LKKKNSGVFGPNLLKQHNKELPISISNTKKVIENSFESIKKVKEGYQHPGNKNLTAKNVYEILPFHHFPGVEFTEIVFPNDPLNDLEQSLFSANTKDNNNNNLNEENLIPDKFLLKKMKILKAM